MLRQGIERALDVLGMAERSGRAAERGEVGLTEGIALEAAMM